MKGYKLFNDDLTCRGFQYEVGKEYKIDGEPIICRRGFHFCERIEDCYDYYPYGSRICEVEALDEIVGEYCINHSNKYCTNHIKIVREIVPDYKQININDINGITLLSAEEAESIPKYIRSIGKFWWLRSLSFLSNSATGVNSNGLVGSSCLYVKFGIKACVRPALILNLKYSNLKNMDRVSLFGHTWTVVLNKYLLCDKSIGYCSFRKNYEADDSDIYEKSDVKTYIEKWLKEKLNE